MRVAIPVKMNRENPPISPLFGKAKWFAVVDIDDNRVEIIPNGKESGREVVDWLHNIGVEALIIQGIGFGPYEMIKDYEDITLYHAGFGRVLLQEALEKFKKDELEILDDTNIENIFKHKGSKRIYGSQKEESFGVE